MRAFLGAFLVLLAADPAGAGVEPELDPDALARGQALLARYTTKEQLSRHLGKDPFACAAVAADREICTWSLGNRDPAWSALAASLPTDDRINVVCELATPGGALAAEDCSIHPRRSNRYSWKPKRGSSKQRMKRKGVYEREMRERQQQAAEMLAAAGSALELSRVVGQGPSTCAASAGQRRCTWYATSHTQGHGTLMMAIAGSTYDKVWMACTLPESGPRDPEACEIEVGAEPRP